ncbi:Transforming growth factor-beta receptor-associated protein 1-like [Oopsacas minuta]|uniref:Transforming growth factor-beta receptor-associated protein 1-like n=1 Tax=Oopsacas minuta TaxID=111878 RepID=A0AAV7JQ33_9METZ|nr:Transforming growth factor-beta receptor-associated protein 1-like [Oopsacas minuta]
MSILYGRMGQHEKALEILVYKFGDINGKALEYCIDHSKGKSRNIRQDIYGKLLKVYLEPIDGSKPLFEEALLLLNNPNVDINPRTALQLLPDEWSVKKLGLFLQRSLRKHNHYYRTTAIEHSLAKWEHIRAKNQIINEDCKRTFITENKECQLCKQEIGDSAFVRYPNEVIIHMKCMKNKNICPVTGIWFGGTS